MRADDIRVSWFHDLILRRLFMRADDFRVAWFHDLILRRLFMRADDIRPYKERSIEMLTPFFQQVLMSMDLRTRKKNRIEGYDYSSRGAYFITICVEERTAFLWEQGVEIVHPDQPPLSQYGLIVDTAIRQIAEHYDNIVLDRYCIMPDHVHMIVFILPNGKNHYPPVDDERTYSTHATIQTMVGSMKRWVSKQIGFPIWQKSFHDRILWNQEEYREVCQYVSENPMKLSMHSTG